MDSLPEKLESESTQLIERSRIAGGIRDLLREFRIGGAKIGDVIAESAGCNSFVIIR